jgi:hypothetical protein
VKGSDFTDKVKGLVPTVAGGVSGTWGSGWEGAG